MNVPQTTLLVTLTGRDRPGVTARLFSVLARHELDVIDAEQVVIRGRLVLGVLLGSGEAAGPDRDPPRSLRRGRRPGLEAEIATGTGDEPRRRAGGCT